MKTFGFTSRDKTGALKKGSLQAIDRADALRQIKASGCVPVSVLEHSGVSAGTSLTWNPIWKTRTLWLAGAAVLLIVALAAWKVLDKKPIKPAAPRVVETRIPPKKAQDSKADSLAAKTTHTLPSVPSPRPASAVTEPPSPSLPQTAATSTTTAQPTTEEPQPPPQPPQPPNPYKSQTEQLLAMAMSVQPGNSVPPLPISPNLDADFANSLTSKIIVFDDDSEHTVITKENVAAAKEQLLELVKQGRNVSEVLKEYQDKINEQAELRNQAQKELKALYQSGNTEEAKVFLGKINASFKEQGIQEIAMPRSRKK